MLYWLTEKILLGYIYSTFGFLLLIFVFKRNRVRSSNFLNLSNLIAFFGMTINLILVGTDAIKCRFEQINQFQKAKITGYNFFYTQSCFTVFIYTFIFAFFIQLCFLYKRNRQKIGLTIISILLLLFVFNLEQMLIFITSFFRDFLPSSWRVLHVTLDRLWTIIFSVFYFIICWQNQLFMKKGKNS